MDRVWMYHLARIDPIYLENIRQFVEEVKRHANSQNKNDIFFLVLTVKTKCVAGF
jgi:hypothetical protein